MRVGSDKDHIGLFPPERLDFLNCRRQMFRFHQKSPGLYAKEHTKKIRIGKLPEMDGNRDILPWETCHSRVSRYGRITLATRHTRLEDLDGVENASADGRRQEIKRR